MCLGGKPVVDLAQGGSGMGRLDQRIEEVADADAHGQQLAGPVLVQDVERGQAYQPATSAYGERHEVAVVEDPPPRHEPCGRLERCRRRYAPPETDPVRA